MTSAQPFPAARVLGEGDPDERLVERCLEGDREAFATLVRRYQRPIFHAAYRVLGREEDASDVTQAVFLKMVERMRDFDPRYRFFSWIYRIAINEALNHIARAANRTTGIQSEPVSEADRPDQAYADREMSAMVQECLMELSPDLRAVVVLRHFAGRSYSDIADAVGVPEKTVKSRLFTARQRLKLLLEGKGVLR